MAKKKSKGAKPHAFRNRLVLNQWLMSLFGVDPLDQRYQGTAKRPFHDLIESIKSSNLEGLDHDNVHKFYHALVNSDMFWNDISILSKEEILVYEENIVRHTQTINERRVRPVVWKYFQWLSLLFVEIYLDRFFGNRDILRNDLNGFIERFNRRWPDYDNIPPYEIDDLNKICLQNATGSGKTLLMHVNLLQYRHFSKKYGKDKDLSRVILLTPNERLSEQHVTEFKESNISADPYLQTRSGLFGWATLLNHVDVLEITKLADQEGPNTIATRSLGDQNLLLVDEGHRGMSGKDEGVWFTRRSDLCARGFSFEYSATFEQAVKAANNQDFENSYAKSILFDYSYRWFYEDGFGKDYQIINLPESFDEIKSVYLTACLLKYYQQLHIYENDKKSSNFKPFNIEKPLWVFVGSTVSKAKGGSDDEKIVATDVAQIIQFIADFLENKEASCRRIHTILIGNGEDTGLIDSKGNDIFAGAFNYLTRNMNACETIETLYHDILGRLFNNRAGGQLVLSRIKGESGEIALRVGQAETPFGLINVGDAKGLCDHVADVASTNGTKLSVEDSDFSEAMFASVKDSSSPVNLLIGSKKFVEGWDCWRVSALGLMHVGQSEGAQIIQLFGRGVRLKGYEWSLKRSGHINVPVTIPSCIEELETLNVFGIEANFMEKFREFLKDEGLPGNEQRQTFTIPLNVTYDFGSRLKILRPKRKLDGKEYDYKKDGPVPTIGDVPKYFYRNKVVTDWYPRIQAIQSRQSNHTTIKNQACLREQHCVWLDYDELFFDLERFKRERSWYNLNITTGSIKALLSNPNWYTLYIPENTLNPKGFEGVRLLQHVANELVRRYCQKYYNYCKRQYIEPRLELRELTRTDDNIPKDEFYQLIVDGDEAQVIQGIQQIKQDLASSKDDLIRVGDLNACNFGKHLFQPLFHVRRGGKITILPVVLNESEYQFVTDLKDWCDSNKHIIESKRLELFLLRNMSRGKGVGFFEAGGFHPDFILWILDGDKQYVTFIEPHGLVYESIANEKFLFYQRIKDIEKRLNDPIVILNCFILSWTQYPRLQWGKKREELEDQNVLFMTDDRDHYIEKLLGRIIDF